MIDQELKQRLNEKIQAGEFTAADIPSYLALFCQIGSSSEDVQNEVDGWDCGVALDLAGFGSYWLAVSGGQFTSGEGRLEQPTLRLSMSAAEAARIFGGQEDAQSAFMSGALRVEGELPDAIKLRDLIELVSEEIEY